MGCVIGSVSEVKKGAFEWQIPFFFENLRGHLFYFRSPRFEFLGEEWRMSMNAQELQKGEELKFAIQKKSSGEMFSEWTVGIQTSNGTTYVNGTVSGTKKLFPLVLPICLSKLKDLRSSLVPSDTLTFFCIAGKVSDGVERSQSTETSDLGVQGNVDVKIQTAERYPADEVSHPTSGTDDLSQNLKGLLESSEFSDATIRVREVDFRVHKAIMAARTIMFRHDTTESASGVVDIKECEPEIFRKFLEYVYTGKLEELSTQNAADLYQIADKYQIDKLKEECLQRMNSDLSVQTFCHVIRVSLRHDEKELTAKATDFFVEHASEIVQTVEWQNFMAENPTWANELIVKAFKAVKK